MRKIFLVALILNVLGLVQAKENYESIIEAGWMVYDGFHIGGSVGYFYFGFNLCGDVGNTVTVSAFEGDTYSSFRQTTSEISARSTRFQIPLGFQYYFGDKSRDYRFGLRAAWVPTILYCVGETISKVDLTDTTYILGDLHYWNGHTWIKYNSFSEDIQTKFDPLNFEVGILMRFNNPLNLGLSVLISDSIKRSRLVLSLGYSFSRYLNDRR